MAKIIISEFEKTLSGEMTHLITLSNQNNASVTLSDYGATILSLCVPDNKGRLQDVVLGYEHIVDYESGDTFFGATVGRCCNRIARGQFTLEEKEYQLAINSAGNHLHGGVKNFSRKVWKHTIVHNKAVFTLESPDGEENYPGNMSVQVTYSLDDTNTLTMEYRATTDKTTICNMTNHAYFNLNGHESGNLKNQFLQIQAERFVPVDQMLIPTGELAPVEGTPFDFTKGKELAGALTEHHEQMETVNGFDQTFVLEQAKGPNAIAYSTETGIRMECITTQPGIQLYTANFVNVPATIGKAGMSYGKNSAFCLEAQNYPDAINHENFPSVVLKPGENYIQTTSFNFSIMAE